MKNVYKFAGPVTALALLSGCATSNGTSSLRFAPPLVLTEKKLVETDACTMVPNTAIEVNSVDGAADLVNNYIYAYRCHTGALSGGRKIFQVPAYLGIAATTVAVALGAGPTVALAGGSFASVSNAGNSYYAPQQKSIIVNKALNALICIQAESVGVPAFAPPDPTTLPVGDSTGRTLAAKVEVSWERQYFTMVKAALLSVETVVRERLVSAGTYNASGTVAEIEALQKKRDEAVKAANDNKDAAKTGEKPATATGETPAGGTAIPAAKKDQVDNDPPVGDLAPAANGKAKTPAKIPVGPDGKSVKSPPPAAPVAPSKSEVRDEAKAKVSNLALAEMQPKLDLCVARAKI